MVSLATNDSFSREESRLRLTELTRHSNAGFRKSGIFRDQYTRTDTHVRNIPEAARQGCQPYYFEKVSFRWVDEYFLHTYYLRTLMYIIAIDITVPLVGKDI